MSDLEQILLKEYDCMRNEIRLYINKYYLGLTAILGIFTAGIFKNNIGKEGAFIFIWIPFIIAGLIGFMAMITFFINKTAGYVRFIEWRIARLYSTKPPSAVKNDSGVLLILAPIFWESFYADAEMSRDRGNQFRSLFGYALKAMGLAAISMLVINMGLGYGEAQKWEIICRYKWVRDVPLEYAYLVTSSAALFLSSFVFWKVNTAVRKNIGVLNDKLYENFVECETSSQGCNEGFGNKGKYK